MGGGGVHVPVHGEGGGHVELPVGLLVGGGRVAVVVKEGGEELGKRDALGVVNDGRVVLHAYDGIATAGIIAVGGGGVP